MKSSHLFIALSTLVFFSSCTMGKNSVNTPIPTEPKTISISGTLLPRDTVSEPVSTGHISVQSFSGNLK